MQSNPFIDSLISEIMRERAKRIQQTTYYRMMSSRVVFLDGTVAYMTHQDDTPKKLYDDSRH
jgi:hypothetical protein